MNSILQNVIQSQHQHQVDQEKCTNFKKKKKKQVLLALIGLK